MAAFNITILNDPEYYKRLFILDRLLHVNGIFAAYFLSVALILGIVWNLLIIFIFSRESGSRGVSDSLRIYYLALAFDDLLRILEVHASAFLSDGLTTMTNGAFSYGWGELTNLTCKIKSYIYFFVSIFSNCLRICLSSERLIALYFPFHMRKWATKRNAIRSTLIVLIFSGSTAIPAFFVSELVNFEKAGLIHGTFCLSAFVGGKKEILWIHLFATISSAFIYPNCILLISTAAILIKLRIISHNRMRLSSGYLCKEQNNNTNSKREISAALTVIVILVVHLAFNVPRGTLLAIYSLVANFHYMDIIMELIIYKSASLWERIMIFERCWNFWLYTYRIPSFRKELKKIICIRIRAST